MTVHELYTRLAEMNPEHEIQIAGPYDVPLLIADVRSVFEEGYDGDVTKFCLIETKIGTVV